MYRASSRRRIVPGGFDPGDHLSRRAPSRGDASLAYRQTLRPSPSTAMHLILEGVPSSPWAKSIPSPAKRTTTPTSTTSRFRNLGSPSADMPPPADLGHRPGPRTLLIKDQLRPFQATSTARPAAPPYWSEARSDVTVQRSEVIGLGPGCALCREDGRCTGRTLRHPGPPGPVERAPSHAPHCNRRSPSSRLRRPAPQRRRRHPHRRHAKSSRRRIGAEPPRVVGPNAGLEAGGCVERGHQFLDAPDDGPFADTESSGDGSVFEPGSHQAEDFPVAPLHIVSAPARAGRLSHGGGSSPERFKGDFERVKEWGGGDQESARGVLAGEAERDEGLLSVDEEHFSWAWGRLRACSPAAM
ncbi:hypothetical protein DWB77_07378 [Streptomyces hundungensis]|uniref:Uncharacterized protein n=1 Tax=Streptomyces hundungensis TaxID=1077946 RepID=A0A387HQ37_9ACTN|nr:hypothetical protein DWB77_07378 [Streptomyces hundungensis]